MHNFKPKKYGDKYAGYVYYSGESGRVVKFEIRHRSGGMNYFSGKVEQRGIEVAIGDIELQSRGNGISMEVSTPMNDTNARLLIAEYGRYSEKKITAVATVFDKVVKQLCDIWIGDRENAETLLFDTAREAAKAV